MKYIEEIQDSTITKIRFTCEDEEVIDNIYDYINAIKLNTSIETVELYEDFLGCVRSDARTELIGAIGQVPCLKELRLEQGLVQIIDLAELLCDVQWLRVLTMKNLVLQGTEEDFRASELALNQHIGIKEFSLEGCSPAVRGISLEAFERVGMEQACAHGGIRPSTPNRASARSA